MAETDGCSGTGMEYLNFNVFFEKRKKRAIFSDGMELA